MAKAKYRKRADGRWGTTVWDGTYTDDGRKHRIPLYSSKSSGDLEKKVNEYNYARKEGRIIVNTDKTFIGYARAWLVSAKSVRAKGTYRVYENIIETHLAEIGDVTFDAFTHSMVQLLINNNLGKPQTCKQIVMTCKQIVRAAEKDRLLPRGSYLDIFDGLTIPPYTPAEKRPLTQQEKDTLKTADFTPREKMFVLLLYGTGFRRGEALALTVFDVSFKDKTIKIDKALAFDKGRPYISSPKTKNSYRTNPIPDWLVKELKTYINTLNLTAQAHLFCKKDGSPMDLNAYCRMWHSIVKKMKNSYLSQLSENQTRMVNWNEVGFEDLTAHIFRHNYCTSLCYQMVTQRNISTKKLPGFWAIRKKWF